ncbi:uncharacterized protein LOC142358751 [Convolutriloba macropyga]|uniref:uncharacterized protein LOC142358751 n=1 Tax=Convolutriloba macropyga TaxID=536237 RepID=UPI003F51EE92
MDATENDERNSSSSSESEDDEVVEEMNETLEINPTQQESELTQDLDQTLHVIPTQFANEDDSDVSSEKGGSEKEESEAESEAAVNIDAHDGNDDDIAPSSPYIEATPQSPVISPKSPPPNPSSPIVENPESPPPPLKDVNNDLIEEEEEEEEASSSSGSEDENADPSSPNEQESADKPEPPVRETLNIDNSTADEYQDTALNHDNERIDEEDRLPNNSNEEISKGFGVEDNDADDESSDNSDDESDDEAPKPVPIADSDGEGKSAVLDTLGLLPEIKTTLPENNDEEDEEYDPEDPEMRNNDDELDEPVEPADKQNASSPQEVHQTEEGNTVIDHQPDEENADESQKPQEAINDIFGSSDSGEEFEGFDDADLEREQAPEVEQQQEKPQGEGSEDESVSDFDRMLLKKKEETAKRRKRRHKEDTIINDQDDKILNMITLMRQAADDDRSLNRNNKAALEKLKLLNSVVYELKKCHLLTAFVENGVLLSVAEWLTPLPDKSLPHLQIRTNLLQILESFPALDSAMLRESGIGKAVMLLYKHPKETRDNRIKAGKLVNKWARPIFQLTADFGAMTKADREQRDLEKMPPQKRRKDQSEKKRDEDEDAPKGPGDAGFVLRARVPQPSFKDYVVRPKSKFENPDAEDDDEETEMPKPRGRSVIVGKSRLDKYIQKDRERKTKAKNTHAVKVNLNGGKI